MGLTLIRKEQIRTYGTIVSATDTEQLSGNDLLLYRDGVKTDVISDLTTQDTAGKGAALVGVDNTGNTFGAGNNTVQAALGYLKNNAGYFVGLYGAVASLPAASAANNLKVAAVYNSSDHTQDGLYQSNGTTWDRKGAFIDYASGQYEIFDDVDLNGKEIIGLPASPTTGSAAVSKTYVDSLLSGRKWKDPVEYKADIVVAAYSDLPSVTTADNGKYGFVVGDDSGNGLLYQVAAGAWPTQTTGAVSPTNGELLMLNGGHLGITNEVSDDDVLEYQSAADKWDYDDTNGRTITTTINDTRIYTVDDNGYTYDADTSKWVLADATGGTVGDRTYTEENWVADGETSTASIDKLDIELKDLYDAVGLATNEDITALTYGTEHNVVSTGTALEVAITALDLKWGDLASTNASEGASLVGLQDAATNWVATNLETLATEIANRLKEKEIKGFIGYKQDAGSGATGEISFSNNSDLITITASNFTGITTFMNQTADNTWGTDSAGNFTAMNLFAAAGFMIQVEVDGTVQPVRYITWTNASNTLTVKLDGNLKSKDFVVVRLFRNAYHA